MTPSLRISGEHHQMLREHLIPGDGLEAVAFAICGRHRSATADVLIVQRIVPVPHELCRKQADRVTWPTTSLAPLLDEARRRRLGIVKFHSHPSGYEQFSPWDDESDRETFASVASWLDDCGTHGSVVMLPDGRLFGRAIASDGNWLPFAGITVVGDDITYWYPATGSDGHCGAFETHRQLFGSGTTERLRRLQAGVVGCSGTGSVVIELLARLGIGSLVLVDPDKVEERNLNRILNAKRADIGRLKVDVLAEAVESMGLGAAVKPLPANLFDPEAVRAVAGCDLVFGCVDTVEGRHLLNRIATFYVIPYFDLGVHLRSDGDGGIDEASGVVHYLQPGRSSLLSRKAFTMERVRAENLFRTDPDQYREQRKAGYIEGVDEKSPAVVSVNATIASLAVNEFLARMHPFRSRHNSDSAVLRFTFMETLAVHEAELAVCPVISRHVGRGDVAPLLDWPSLSEKTSQ
jgi:hypothetical protein